MHHLRLVTASAVFAALASGPSQAQPVATIEVAPGGGELARLLSEAPEGTLLGLLPGDHPGSIVISRRLTLEGAAGARVLGNGRGSVIRVEAPGAIVRGLAVTGSGRDAEGLDSGIFIAQTARGARAEANRVADNLYGIYIHGAPEAVVTGNTIIGLREGRVNEAGNGVSVWNAPGAQVIDNRMSYGRDGIFSVTSKNNVFRGNRFENMRFAIHYMYTNDAVVADNISVGNNVGYAIMFSHRLKVTGNVSQGDRDHGFLFNYANGSVIENNLVLGQLQPASRWLDGGTRGEHGVPTDDAEPVTVGQRSAPTKCVFIYNANQNRFRGNWFEGCEIGIHFTAGSERNEMSGNAFLRNQRQVKYVGSRYLDWSAGGRGNYWSDNPAFDLDGNGLADAAYRPNDLMDKVLWTAPQAKVLANSPAVQVIRWAQSQFPALLPGGVVDSHPLMRPPPRPEIREVRP